MDSSPPDAKTHLEWTNVALGLAFVALTALLSEGLQLGVGAALVSAALRCIVQLALVATVLQRVFAAQNAWAVAGIALVLNVLGTFETGAWCPPICAFDDGLTRARTRRAVVNKTQRRYRHMFLVVLLAMLVSTIPTSILGARFAMGVTPFWKPEQYIPVVGMLCGSTISGVAVSVSYILKELDENRDKTETLLALGASRFEACRPLAVDALRLALTPTINQMSVLGIIAIPGMMTGAILGGADVQQAARLQMVIMFMIAAANALASMVATLGALVICVDGEHRIRSDRIDARQHLVWRAAASGLGAAARWLGAARRATCGAGRKRERAARASEDSERAPLLG
ncbi:UPF0014-domain-containing protein [Gloeopeniophorella convolvens]|nr:UPF0014-domain-containing protein [Gloeopeniophorella convolvens]